MSQLLVRCLLQQLSRVTKIHNGLSEKRVSVEPLQTGPSAHCPADTDRYKWFRMTNYDLDKELIISILIANLN